MKMLTRFPRTPARRPASGGACQRGTVLIVAMVFMVVLTLVAVVAMRSTTLDLKITTNTMLKTRAFEGSEATRSYVVGVLDSHVFNRGWPASAGGSLPDSAGFTLPTGLALVDANDLLYLEDVSAPAEGEMDPGDEDMTFRLDGSYPADSDYVDAEDISSDLFITWLGTAPAPGAAISQVSGYEGFGKGAAAGGGYVFFDVRSQGHAPSNTQAVTGAQTRVVIRN